MEKMKNGKCKMQKKSLKKDEQAVSPVIGVIMMIAITVVIAAVVAAFAYGIIGGVAKAPDAALVVDNFKLSTGSTNVTIIHHGGDTITDAFNGTALITTGEKWDNLEVRYNGAKVSSQMSYMNGTTNSNSTAWATNFKAGDELMITFNTISTDDTLTIVYTPTNSVLQRVKVA